MSVQRLQNDLPEALFAYHPSQLKMSMSDEVVDHSVSKRLLTCVVAALRAHGNQFRSTILHAFVIYPPFYF